MRYLRKSTAVDLPIGPFVDATDGVTAETALTITQPDIRLKKNAAAWTQKAAAQTLTHEENGNYELTLDATDTDTLGQLRLHVAEAGALPVWENFMVMPANIWDSFFASGALTAVEALTATVADSVPADGTRPSVAQACYIITQFLLERAVTGTTATIKKPDGTTTLLTLTLGDATSPTTVTRAT